MSSFTRSLQRECQLMRQRPWDLAMISWVPVIGVLLLAWIFSAGLPQRLPIGVLDQDHSAFSRQFVRMLQATPGLGVDVQYLNLYEAQQGLQAMQVYAVVQIPPDVQRQLKQGRSAEIVLLHNAQLANYSSLIQRDLRQVVGTVSAGLEMNARARRGEPLQDLSVRREPIATAMRSMFNISTNYELFLTASLIPALLHILAMTAGAWTVGRELRDRSLGQWLRGQCLPVQPPMPGVPRLPLPDEPPSRPGLAPVAAMVVGKLLLPWASLTAIGIASLLWLVLARHWPMAGSLAWVCAGLGAMIAVSLCAGAAIAAVTASLRMGLSGAAFLSAPAFAFSGLGFPLMAMPVSAQWWANAMPFTHYAHLQLQQMLMGSPVAASALVVPSLLLATLVLLGVTSLGLRRAAQRPARWGGR